MKKGSVQLIEKTRKPDPLKLYKEAVEQQAATAEILRVISSSPADLKPVFEAILASALRLCGGHLGLLNLFNGAKYRTVAQRGAVCAGGIGIRGDSRPSP